MRTKTEIFMRIYEVHCTTELLTIQHLEYNSIVYTCPQNATHCLYYNSPELQAFHVKKGPRTHFLYYDKSNENPLSAL
jgi:hypothetical protein